MKRVRLVVFDLVGTLIQDQGQTMESILAAAHETGLQVTAYDIKPLLGRTVLRVFEKLWIEKLQVVSTYSRAKAFEAHGIFQEKIQTYYQRESIQLCECVIETLQSLQRAGIKTAVVSSHYRAEVDMIFHKANLIYQNTVIDQELPLINFSVAADEVVNGRPAPDMIYKAMENLHIDHGYEVVHVGDTPIDLKAGFAADCLLSIGVSSGIFSEEELNHYESDGILPSLRYLPSFLGLRERIRVEEF